jgi:peptidoglycan L-alanyl-D-glutamate endopeptidase CwlK
MINRWGLRSKQQLVTCHHDLVTLANRVLQIHDASVIFGYRNRLLQNQAYRLGHSKLQFPDSLHNLFPSAAIDLGPYLPGYRVTYDREHTLYFAGIVLGVADCLYQTGEISHQIRWGGDWDRDHNFREHSFYDGIHFELVEFDRTQFQVIDAV